MRPLGQHGFTLVDALAGISVAIIVAAGAVTFVRAQSLAMRTQVAQTDVNDEARSVVELMAREIRLAGYNPQCIMPAPVAALVAAAPQQLRIQYDLDEDGTLDADEDVTYVYDTVDLKLSRVVDGIATDIALDLPPVGFALRYYQSGGTEIVGTGAGGALTAAEMAAVYRIGIKFEPAVTNDARVATTARAGLWTNVLIRNRKYPC